MMNPRDLLDVADQLASESTEACWRSAISRAYYSAFHLVRETLISWGFRVPQGTQAHAYLWMRVSNCGDQLVENAGRKLNFMRGSRNHADYDLHQLVSQLDAIREVQIAIDIIKLFDSLPGSPHLNAIVLRIRTYEQTVLKQVTWTP